MSDNQGVTVGDVRAYLRLDEDSDNDTVLQHLIDAAEADASGAIDDTVGIDVYRGYPMFNQAVRVLVDFNYYNRGQLSQNTLAYPPSYQYMLNSIRFKVKGSDTNGKQA